MDRLMSMRVFQKVVDEGGFAAAARALNMSPAVVTRMIADLESHLGARLLHRTTRHISLSSVGESYLDRVRSILQDIEEADSAASSQTHQLAGVLRILTPPVLSTQVLAPLIADFHRLHPKIWFDIEVDSHERQPIEDYDLTLISTADSFDANVIARKVSTNEVVLVCSPDYLARRGKPLNPEDLAGHDLLLLRESGTIHRVWRLFHAESRDMTRDVTIEPVLCVNHPETLLRAAVSGAGITSIAFGLAAPHLMRGDLVRVLYPWISGRLVMYAALPSRRFMPERTRVFVDFMIEWLHKYLEQARNACS